MHVGKCRAVSCIRWSIVRMYIYVYIIFSAFTSSHLRHTQTHHTYGYVIYEYIQGQLVLCAGFLCYEIAE